MSCCTDDSSSRNVGDLNDGNFEPIAFNHLTGHFTEAFVLPGMSGADQSASWGGSPVVRPAVVNTMNNAALIAADYTTLNGMNRLATCRHYLMTAVVWPKRTPVGWRPMDTMLWIYG